MKSREALASQQRDHWQEEKSTESRICCPATPAPQSQEIAGYDRESRCPKSSHHRQTANDPPRLKNPWQPEECCGDRRREHQCSRSNADDTPATPSDDNGGNRRKCNGYGGCHDHKYCFSHRQFSESSKNGSTENQRNHNNSSTQRCDSAQVDGASPRQQCGQAKEW